MAKWMTNPWRPRWREACGMVVLRAVLLLLAAVLPVRAADSSANPAPLQPAVAAVLEYSETTNGLIDSGISFSRQTQPFRREPAVARGRIFRGILDLGNPSNNVAFLWQRNDGKLWLDLNHNGDLTDDPAGVLATDEKASPYQTFRNVRLQLSTPSGACPVLADLYFWDFGMGPSCSAELHSFWQGKVTLAGQDWQAGIIQNLARPADSCEGDYLLLRAWDRRNEPFTANGPALDAFQFCPKIFAGGHAYEVKWLPRADDGGFKPRLQFTEQTVALGEVHITGQFIQRLMLPGNNSYLVICDRPGPTVKVPVGGYFSPNVLLEQNGVQASGTVNLWERKQFLVATQAVAVLAAGGPLTNSVSAARHNQDLQLNYTLIGAGGQQYKMTTQDVSHPPEYAVYKDGKRIDSGKFAFG